MVLNTYHMYIWVGMIDVLLSFEEQLHSQFPINNN